MWHDGVPKALGEVVQVVPAPALRAEQHLGGHIMGLSLPGCRAHLLLTSVLPEAGAPPGGGGETRFIVFLNLCMILGEREPEARQGCSLADCPRDWLTRGQGSVHQVTRLRGPQALLPLCRTHMAWQRGSRRQETADDRSPSISGEKGRLAFEKMDKLRLEQRDGFGQEAEVEITVF